MTKVRNNLERKREIMMLVETEQQIVMVLMISAMEHEWKIDCRYIFSPSATGFEGLLGAMVHVAMRPEVPLFELDLLKCWIPQDDVGPGKSPPSFHLSNRFLFCPGTVQLQGATLTRRNHYHQRHNLQ